MSIIQIDTDPSRKTLNQFGFIWLGFLIFFGCIAWFKFDQPKAAYVLWALAVIVPVIGWSIPAFMKMVFLGMSYAAWPIGFVVSHVILGLVYYLVFTPIGLIMRLVGYDPMNRRYEAEATSYWAERPKEAADAKRYFRQY